jgi:hypothetical protein
MRISNPTQIDLFVLEMLFIFDISKKSVPGNSDPEHTTLLVKANSPCHNTTNTTSVGAALEELMGLTPPYQLATVISATTIHSQQPTAGRTWKRKKKGKP